MLANNNVSAGRVVTKMEFDINSPVPRLLFSPSAAVPADVREVIARQSKTPAAENAIKLTVYKTDKAEEEAEAPEQEVAQPVVHKTPKPSAAKADDVSDIVKKWTKK